MRTILSRAEWLFVFERSGEQCGVVVAVAREAYRTAIEPQDRWWLIVGAEHEGDASIGTKMSSRLTPAAGQVKICHGALIKNTQGVRRPW
jgi:hypothetical protein